jgi:hypothetical protein
MKIYTGSPCVEMAESKLIAGSAEEDYVPLSLIGGNLCVLSVSG